MKYLGITLDAKLRFTHHILDKCNKAKQLLMLLKRAVGMYWGPPPNPNAMDSYGDDQTHAYVWCPGLGATSSKA